ncbi:DedA family protein [Ancylobacter oerskovii]|uniref:DedA family protein n=1 Tax=Ancylobacter oerskovii TaxID=459519 RepID=A0ABW4YYS7_9HYPH|nr:DedA family protein [Ancylobacter oerskovii]MBS7541676.1 DedA family protein [Ancylobacter oerskovii]
MEQFIGQVGAFIEAHQSYALLLAGIIAFGESLVIVGLFIPATALMMLIGGLMGSGIVEPLPILAGSILGAILGDAVSYLLGRRVGRSLVYKWPLAQYRPSVARARLFFRRYGFASVFFGRFLGPIRSTIPLVAGMMAMKHRPFQIANVTSAFAWAALMLSPGWLAGHTASRLGSFGSMEWVVVMAALTVLFLGVTTVILHRLTKPAPRRRRAAQPQRGET